MSVVEVTYYQAVCDGCGINLTVDGDEEISAWADGAFAVEVLEDSDTYVVGEFVLCVDCVAAAVEAGGDLGEQDQDVEHARLVAWAEAGSGAP